MLGCGAAAMIALFAPANNRATVAAHLRPSLVRGQRDLLDEFRQDGIAERFEALSREGK